MLGPRVPAARVLGLTWTQAGVPVLATGKPGWWSAEILLSQEAGMSPRSSARLFLPVAFVRRESRLVAIRAGAGEAEGAEKMDTKRGRADERVD
jgi:hypothetical protein